MQREVRQGLVPGQVQPSREGFIVITGQHRRYPARAHPRPQDGPASLLRWHSLGYDQHLPLPQSPALRPCPVRWRGISKRREAI